MRGGRAAQEAKSGTCKGTSRELPPSAQSPGEQENGQAAWLTG